jgi:hypothetical protein
MTRNTEQGDFEVARVLFHAHRAETEIVASLVYRGLDRASAAQVLRLIKEGKAPESLSRPRPITSKVSSVLALPFTPGKAKKTPATNSVTVIPKQRSAITTPSSPGLTPRRLTLFGIVYYAACTVIVLWVLLLHAFRNVI